MNLSKYAERQNLLRAAVAVSECKNPEWVLEILQLVLEGCVNDAANGN